MKEQKQQEVWEAHTKNITVEQIISAYRAPGDYQLELNQVIHQLCTQNNYTTTIEIGCETGISSMLLDDSIDRTFFDLNSDAINKAKHSSLQVDKAGHYVVGDMFALPFADNSYDVVFNAGVVEHFTQKQRTAMLIEYSRILQPKGTMVIAIPNHFSAPYRSAYVIRKQLLGGYRWPWPEEYKIQDLKEEIKLAGLSLEDRLTLDKKTIFDFWGPSKLGGKFVKNLWKLSDKLFNYEGYLTTLIIKKN